MMYVVQVEQNGLRASSDRMEAPTALKVAKAWQSHGDRGVRVVEVKGERGDLSGRSWSIREFIAFTKQTPTLRAGTPDLSAGAH